MNTILPLTDITMATSESEIPRIGFLTESLNSHYQSNIWIGASDTAVRLGYTLVCIAGGSLYKSSWNEYEPQRNFLYQFIDRNKLAGVIITGSLGNFISTNKFKSFYDQFINLPMVCLGSGIPSVPTVIVDNTHGMRQLISHLVEKHNSKKIAFVRGPEGNQEAEERLRIFQEVLVEHGIIPDTRLIVKGDFSRDAGINAVEYLIQNELQCDALVGANDDTALGALKAFQEHHLRVPEEILVFGFDDIEESSFSAPPLTTIRQPLYEIGGKSVEVIHDCIMGVNKESTIIVPARLITRQSCGCFRNYESKDVFSVNHEKSISARNRIQLSDEIEKAFRKMIVDSADSMDSILIQDFTDALIEEIENKGSGRFVSEVNKMAWRLSRAGGDTLGLFHLLAIMKKFACSLNKNNLTDRLEKVFQNGYVAVTDSVNRIQANRRLSSERKAYILRNAGKAIASAFDLNQLIGVVATELINLNIDECYISLFDTIDKPDRLRHLKMILALRKGMSVSIETPSNDFNAPDIAPTGVINLSSAISLLIEPLFFKNEQIGLMLFNVDRCRDGLTYEILQQHISSALKGALLMKQVQEQSIALEQANTQLQKLRDAEYAYLKAIKHELELGREIQNSFLPRTIPAIKGWEIVTEFQPAHEVSGDFYDIFTFPDGNVVMTICDVSGKDVSAALYMALIRTLIRALAEQSLNGAVEPLDAVHMTNSYLINHHFGSNERYMYATLFMAVLNPITNTMRYVNAGHNPPVIISEDKMLQWIKTTGPAIGIIPEAKFDKMSIRLDPGDILFMYTDGITESRSPTGEFFSKKRLIDQLNLPVNSAATLINRIKNAVKDHSADCVPFDDITMISVRNNKTIIQLK